MKIAKLTALAFTALFLVLSQLALGQTPKDQLSVGFELQRNSLSAAGYSTPSTNFSGITFSNTVRAYRWFGIEANGSVAGKNSNGNPFINGYVLAGPRASVSLAKDRIEPYGHFLLGMNLIHLPFGSSAAYFGISNNQRAFAMGGGGGASVFVTKHFGVTGGIDYIHSSKSYYDLVTVGLRNVRVTAGPVFRWGSSKNYGFNRGRIPRIAPQSPYPAAQRERCLPPNWFFHKRFPLERRALPYDMQTFSNGVDACFTNLRGGQAAR